MTIDFSLILLGVGTTLALITAIGAQNAFILKQGIMGRPMMPIIIFCIVSDALLYTAGIGGMGYLVEKLPWIQTVLLWGGVIFMVSYGAMAAKRAIRPSGEALVVTPQDAVGPGAHFPEQNADESSESSASTPGGAVRLKNRGATRTQRKTATASPEPTVFSLLLTCAAMTFLNPHTYLDTMVLIGSVANQQGDPGRWLFFFGAVLGSTIWFFALGFGARLLRPVFARPGTWRILDGIIALIMFTLAAHLIIG
ncbi:LysE/ArgO family amino acid transporter [Rothia uropygialis]|uniref:LysE/ArgO family amino acid transporter n=1 Tax=Kocuria sp. 36 TaxID=1415402 RepID=UPI00101E22EB|nr:LysE/ArgO family amino acid transporter [Kocuria sp. 36]